MSSPFLYTPKAPIVHPQLQQSPYFNNPPRISPYIPNVALDPSAPNTPSRQARQLEEDHWAATQPRSRRPSWHAGMASGMGAAQGFGTPSQPFYNYGPPPEERTRRKSFDSRLHRQPFAPELYTVPGTPWIIPPTYPIFQPSQIHPLLSGFTQEPRSQSIIFDLSAHTFNPLRVVGPYSHQPISPQELAQPATHPPTTRLAITCDTLPQWPIYLDYEAATAVATGGWLQVSSPPVTLGDVLYAIHTSMQTQITHLDWSRLTQSEETAIARAYTRRCKAEPLLESVLAGQGVRRVDYLLKKVMFAGLSRAPGDEGYDNLKLLVTTR